MPGTSILAHDVSPPALSQNMLTMLVVTQHVPNCKQRCVWHKLLSVESLYMLKHLEPAACATACVRSQMLQDQLQASQHYA